MITNTNAQTIFLLKELHGTLYFRFMSNISSIPNQFKNTMKLSYARKQYLEFHPLGARMHFSFTRIEKDTI